MWINKKKHTQKQKQKQQKKKKKYKTNIQTKLFCLKMTAKTSFVTLRNTANLC